MAEVPDYRKDSLPEAGGEAGGNEMLIISHNLQS
jgi:hypothetical protein